MTREEILLKSIWDNASVKVFSPLFKREVKIELFTYFETKMLSERMVQAINDFLCLQEDCLPLMKELLYRHCKECCENISYGFDRNEGETEAEANLRQFGIGSAEDAFLQSNLDHIVVDGDDEVMRKNNYVKIIFYPQWEAEHGCELILQNGKLLDYLGESGTYVAQFED